MHWRQQRAINAREANEDFVLSAFQPSFPVFALQQAAYSENMGKNFKQEMLSKQTQARSDLNSWNLWMFMFTLFRSLRTVGYACIPLQFAQCRKMEKTLSTAQAQVRQLTKRFGSL